MLHVRRHVETPAKVPWQAGDAERGYAVPQSEEADRRLGGMLRHLVCKGECQRRTAAEADDVDRRVAGFVETSELLVRFVVARAAAQTCHASDDGAEYAEPGADSLVIEVLTPIGVTEQHDVGVVVGAGVVFVAGAVERVEHPEILNAL